MHFASRRLGRISFVLIAGLCAVGFVVLLFAFSGQSPRASAAQFLSALAKGDAKKLTEFSIVHDETPDQIQKQWESAIKHSPGYLFAWDIVAVSQSGDSAAVKLDFTKDPQLNTSYAEHFELKLVKSGGSWKVVVPEISREMYPYLPH